MRLRPAVGHCLTYNLCGTIMEPPAGRAFHSREQQMSARKLSRLAGLVFVVAAVFSGAGAANAAVVHEAGGSSAVSVSESLRAFDITWG